MGVRDKSRENAIFMYRRRNNGSIIRKGWKSKDIYDKYKYLRIIFNKKLMMRKLD